MRKFVEDAPIVDVLSPFDSRICPYCAKRFETPAVKKEDYRDSTLEERLEDVLNK